MWGMKIRQGFLLAPLLALAGCEEPPLQAYGQLESDRVEVVAESNEPIVEIASLEGDALAAGALILRQDTARLDIRIRESQANIARIEAQLEEQVNGPRIETIEATRASLLEAEIERDFRERELNRLTGLRERNLTSEESVDQARNLLESASARIEIVSARLAELEAGTRPEQIEQTRGLLGQAGAQLDSLKLDRERLHVAAPVDGVVDTLPFEVGERPRPGDVVAVLLTGDQPYARVYIPEPLRAGLRVGSTMRIAVDGIEQPLTGTIRRIAAEASFTPYFALTERDRGRLSFLAEVRMPDLPERLPEGLPVQALFTND
ncbi:MAG: HlyD family efflux transporter periplasmic adaptor subunit [Gammaproteobacteria bacterium]|nr:HlyD family efflux transporter periplasmic adaptor subunit [Gammaproteobacteria bacterium]MYE99663.1 HlyD family efflux transporter periplasmic adaptor subunit [Gammaproteobacteria bacterium]MYH86414.1 HlyD family efflux transporter periplasmic adaptor subunit [Gammaproteobacteria bacterium]MYK05775.1 HlyD family efflux transporter periplasmic adaptor subunit [Gammaproteobacteria bacterium]